MFEKIKKMGNLQLIIGVATIAIVIIVVAVLIGVSINKSMQSNADTDANDTSNQEENQEDDEVFVRMDQELEEVEEETEETDKTEETENKEEETTTNVEIKYFIRVNYGANVVTIYTKDSNGNYTVPYKAMVCSTGSATPTSGTYTIPSGTYSRGTWGLMFGNVWAQYFTRIKGSILFHSVPYTQRNKWSLEYWEYDKLGTTASAGCVRLTVKDAKWIYNNCPAGTKVEFYSDSNPGPLGKPTAQKISDEEEVRGWDPTDPDSANPWKTYTSTTEKETTDKNNNTTTTTPSTSTTPETNQDGNSSSGSETTNPDQGDTSGGTTNPDQEDTSGGETTNPGQGDETNSGQGDNGNTNNTTNTEENIT